MCVSSSLFVVAVPASRRHRLFLNKVDSPPLVRLPHGYVYLTLLFLLVFLFFIFIWRFLFFLCVLFNDVYYSTPRGRNRKNGFLLCFVSVLSALCVRACVYERKKEKIESGLKTSPAARSTAFHPFTDERSASFYFLFLLFSPFTPFLSRSFKLSTLQG